MKICQKCGSAVDDGLKFCTNCGTALPQSAAAAPPPVPSAPVPPPAAAPPASQPASAPMPQPAQQPAPMPQPAVDGDVRLCPDGKYRWIYELNMWTNTSILRVLLKIFGGIVLVMWGINVIICLVDGDWDAFWSFSKVMLIVLGVLLVLTLVSYAILALIYGGKYIVLFEMNERGVLHRQLKSQVKKSQAIGWLSVLSGIASGNPGTIGIGITAATHTETYSGFQSVRSVKPFRKRNLIKVNELLFKNQVYVKDEDFDFVYDYIRSRCPRVK